MTGKVHHSAPQVQHHTPKSEARTTQGHKAGATPEGPRSTQDRTAALFRSGFDAGSGTRSQQLNKLGGGMSEPSGGVFPDAPTFSASSLLFAKLTGRGAATRLAMGANPDAASVAQAQADYTQLKGDAQQKGKPPQHAFIAQLKAHADDPAYQAELIRQARQDKGPDGLNLLTAEGLMSPAAGVFGRSIIDGKPSPDYTDDERKTFTQAMGAARDKGVFTNAELAKLAQPDPGSGESWPWQELASRMGVPGAAQSPLAAMPDANQAVSNISQAHAAYTDAKTAKQQADAKLQAELAGPDKALTPGERQKFIAQYKQNHADVYKAYDDAAKTYAATVKQNTPALEAGAKAQPPVPGAAQALHDAYTDIAQTPYARDALDFAVRVSNDPALSAAFPDKDGFIKDIVAPAIPNALGMVMANASDPQNALAQARKLVGDLQANLGPIKDAKSLGSAIKQGFSDLKTGLDDLQQLQNDLKAGKNVNVFEQQLASKIEDWSGKGPFGKALAVGGAMWGFKACFDDLGKNDGLAVCKDFATALKGAGDVATQAIGAWAKDGTELAKSLGGDAAKFLERFVPFVGAAASALSLAVDVRDAHNAGDLVNVVGDVFTFAGAALECGGLTTPIGEVLAAGGSIVSAAGSALSKFLDWQSQRKDFQDEQTACLKAAGINDPAVIDTLINADPEQMATLAGPCGLSPEKLKQLARDRPFLLTGSSGNGLEPDNLVALVKAGVKPDALFKLLDNAPETFLLQLNRYVGEHPSSLPTDVAGWQKLLETMSNQDTPPGAPPLLPSGLIAQIG